MTRSRTWLAVLAFAFVVYGLWLVDQAAAAVHVRIAADAPQGPVLSTNGYVVTLTTDEPVTLKTVKLLLPGHGAPPISEDVYGQPRDTDDDTQFVVLDAHGRDVTVTWWMANGTDSPLTIDTERFGVRAGAAYEGSTLDPVAKVRHVSSLGIIWHHAITLDPGQTVEHTVYLTSGCGIGQMGARLRIYAGDVLAGTGDAGPHWKLPDCGGAS